MAAFPPTPRTQLKRLPQRGVYDEAVVHAILDEAFLCHVGFVVDGQPYVIPTGFGRSGNQLFIHGSAASRIPHVWRKSCSAQFAPSCSLTRSNTARSAPYVRGRFGQRSVTQSGRLASKGGRSRAM